MSCGSADQGLLVGSEDQQNQNLTSKLPCPCDTVPRPLVTRWQQGEHQLTGWLRTAARMHSAPGPWPASTEAPKSGVEKDIGGALESLVMAWCWSAQILWHGDQRSLWDSGQKVDTGDNACTGNSKFVRVAVEPWVPKRCNSHGKPFLGAE